MISGGDPPPDPSKKNLAAIYACDRSVYIHLSKTLLDQILEINHALNGIVDKDYTIRTVRP